MALTEPVVIPNQASASVAFKLPEPHQPKPQTSATPSADDISIVAHVQQLLTIARDYRQPLVPRWRHAYRMLFNKFWTQGRPGWQPSPEIPEIYPIIRAYVGFMLDQRIGFNISPYALPVEPFTEWLNKLADDLEVTLESSWQANREEREWGMIVQDALVYGTGISKTAWETALGGGIGDAMTRRVHPSTFYPDPRATTEMDGDFYIELKKMSVQEVDRRWPGSAELIQSGGQFSFTDDMPNLLDLNGAGRGNVPYANPNAGLAPATGSWQPSIMSGSRIASINMPAVTVVEAWIREHHFVEVTDERTGEKAKLPRETWRCVIIAGNHVLMNAPATDLWKHGQHPYSRYVWDEKGEFWGPSMVELLTSSQNMVNRLLSALQQNVELTGNPVWKEGTRSGAQRTPITNKPGTRVTVADGAAGGQAGWVNPPQLQEVMMQLLQYHLQRMETISGITAMNKGNTPGGRPAQGVVDSVQESAFVTIRQAQRNLEYAMSEAGWRQADLVIENYTTPRMVSIAGPSSERSMLALKARHFQIPTGQGAIPMKYQLFIDAGSRSHTSRMMVQSQAAQMYAIGAIDRLSMLEAVEWPDAAKVAARAQAAEAAQAQQTGSRQQAGRSS